MLQILSRNKKGFIFLEVLIASALIGIVFITLLGMGFLALNISTSIKQTTRANFLMQEALEAMRSFRDGSDWAANGLGVVNTGSANPYYATLDTTVNPPAWKLLAGTETVGGFTRSLVFDKVSRNPSNQDIEAVYNSANNDPDSRKITVTVASGSTTYQVVEYLTNWNP